MTEVMSYIISFSASV